MTARAPVRTCVGCREEGTKSSLVRLVRAADGTVHLDPPGLASGRGAYLHLNERCIEQARRRKALERALKARVPESLWAELVPSPAGGPAGGGLGGGPSRQSLFP
jgi:predicted RNA-binding protein YlxR (DUF448 family)